MDKLARSRRPVEEELAQYKALFDETLAHEDDFLGRALEHIRQRHGKMMRPLLVLLMARERGEVGRASLLSAVTLELLHTASLVHDDVVDESKERRGQRSVNAVYDNKVAVLLGDYLLSKSLEVAGNTQHLEVVKIISALGGTLSEGEIFQLANIRSEESSEAAYFRIISSKTAALFAACAELGALSAGGGKEYVARAKRVGQLMGICFQIRDDIFDYFSTGNIGKPTGNDMHEGKLTLPAIFALSQTTQNEPLQWAKHVKDGTATAEEISRLVDFTIRQGGIAYAEKRMQTYRAEAANLLSAWTNPAIRQALTDYLDFIIEREL